MDRRRWSQLGQGAVEFALITPVLMLMLFGLLEAGLLLFGTGTANFAAAEAARVASERGDQADADTQALSRIQNSPLGTTGILKINQIQIFKVYPNGAGGYVADTNSCSGYPCENDYAMDGTPISQSWDPTLRKVTNSGSDYIGVRIVCQYNWRTGIFNNFLPPVQLSPVFYVKLEPQSY